MGREVPDGPLARSNAALARVAIARQDDAATQGALKALRRSPADRMRSVAAARREEVEAICSAGEFTRAFYLTQAHPEDGYADELELLQTVRTETLRRAVATEDVAETPGLIPTVVSGDLLTFADEARNVWNLARSGKGPLPMVGLGEQIHRPSVTTRPVSGVQATEFDQLASGAAVIDFTDIDKKTCGLVVDESEQVADFTEAAGQQKILEDLATAYGEQTEALACAAMESACTSGNSNVGHLSLTASAADLTASASVAFGNVFAASRAKPDAWLTSIDRMVYLLGLVDSDGLPLYSIDKGPCGLPIVASPFFQHGFVAVVASSYVECYEQNRGLAQLAIPSTLGLSVAYRGYAASFVAPRAIFSLEDLNIGGGSWSS